MLYNLFLLFSSMYDLINTWYENELEYLELLKLFFKISPIFNMCIFFLYSTYVPYFCLLFLQV